MRRIRKDDTVEVTTGKDRGTSDNPTRGRVVKVFTGGEKLLVEGVNYVNKHQRVETRQGGGGQEGGIIETEAPIHASNVMPVCPKCRKATRVRFVYEHEGDRRSKVRACAHCNATF